MSSTTAKLVEWGGILLLVFFVVPRLLGAMGGSNARTAAQYSPAAAWNAQAARGINTAGMVGNTALARALSQLLGQRPQQQQTARGSAPSGGNAPGISSAGRAGSVSNPEADANFQRYFQSVDHPLSGYASSPGANLYAGTDWANYAVAPAPDFASVDHSADYGASSIYDAEYAASWAAVEPAPDFWAGDYTAYNDYSGLFDSSYFAAVEPAPDFYAGDYTAYNDYSGIVDYGYADYGYSDYSDGYDWSGY